MRHKILYLSLFLIGLNTLNLHAENTNRQKTFEANNQDQLAFDNLVKEIEAMLQETRNELDALYTKLNDEEFLSTLSLEEEKHLFSLYEEGCNHLRFLENQCYEVLNQVQSQIMQKGSNYEE